MIPGGGSLAAGPICDGVVAAGVIVDFERAEVVAAVDRMGLHALYWSRDGERVQIASRAADARPPAPASRPALDPAALYAYVYFHHVPSPLSIYRGVAKLPRAHSLRVRGADTAVHRYRLEQFPTDTVTDSIRSQARS